MTMLRTSSLAAASAALLCSCASIKSTMNAKETDGGLVYYMPKRDIVITVTTANEKVASIVPTVSAPYADRTKTYVLEYQRHPLAKNTLDVDVSEAGLLTSSKANQTGDAVAALGALGTLVGYVSGAGFGIESDAVKARTASVSAQCSLNGNHTFIVPAQKGSGKICNAFSYKVEPMFEETPRLKTTQQDGEGYPGVFYRVNKPYKVTISSDAFNSETLVLSPSESQEFFLPVARTFFANNDAKITLANGAGVPSKYVQDTDGEVAALLKLPAALVAPYFAAIGQVFSGVSGNKGAEKTTLESSTSLELAKMKYQSCLNAIEAKDTALIASLKCGGN